MNQIIFNKSIFIICCSLVLSACNSYPHQYSTYDTLTGIIAPAGQYSEWYTDSKSDTSGSRNIHSQKNCTQNEESEFSANGVITVRQNNCNSNSQSRSSSSSRSRSSSVGFSIAGPIGASLGLIKQAEEMNQQYDNKRGEDMFKEFGF